MASRENRKRTRQKAPSEQTVRAEEPRKAECLPARLWKRVKTFLLWLLRTLGDRTNICIFLAVCAVVSCEVWIPYLLAVLTGNEWWWAVGSACWAFWLAPFTPFIPLCIAVTAAVRKIADKIRKKPQEKRRKNGENTCNRDEDCDTIEKTAKGDGTMWFSKKKKETEKAPAEKTVQEILGEMIAKQSRTEGVQVRIGFYKPENAPCAFLKEEDLGPTLREDLGEEGAVLLYYLESEKKLVFRLTFSYGEGSDEMELIGECLDSIDIEEDEELRLPGDVTAIHTEYMVDENDEIIDATDINFISEGIEKEDVARAADSLVGYVFHWLDVVYETMEEEFGEGDEDEEDEEDGE